MSILILVIYYVGIYLWGSVPYSILVTKAKGIDLLQIGSKNAGATNVYRALGIKYAILVFGLDFLKGYLACLATNYFFHTPLQITIAAAMVIVGHTFSPFLNFNGGKGAATALGVVLFIDPLIFTLCAILASVIIMMTRYVSLATIITTLFAMILVNISYFHTAIPYKVFFTVIGIYIIFKHKTNIHRLIKGQEKRV